MGEPQLLVKVICCSCNLLAVDECQCGAVLYVHNDVFSVTCQDSCVSMLGTQDPSACVQNGYACCAIVVCMSCAGKAESVHTGYRKSEWGKQTEAY